MKRIQRLLLGMIRRPVKSIVLMLTVFIMANVISASFMLYNASSEIVGAIENEIAPFAYFYSPLSNYYIPEVKKEDKLKLIDFNRDQRTQMIENHMKALEEIGKLEEVKYYDYAMETSLINTDKVVFNKSGLIGGTILGKNGNGESLDVDPHQPQFITGINQSDFYYLHEYKAEIIEGRTFSQKEIDEGAHVVLVPKYTKYDEGNYIKVGDKIHLSNRIISNYLNHQDFMYVKDYLEAYEKTILDEKTYEFEVIGIYDDPERNERIDKGLEVAYGEPTIMMPLTTANEMRLLNHQLENKYLDKIVTFNGLESHINERMMYDRFNYFELHSNDDMESFSKKAKAILEKYHLEYHQIYLSNDMYLKLAGPLSGVKSVSQTFLIGGSIIFFVVLMCISLLFVKDRKKEIGLYMAFGESKNNIIKQMMGEIVVIGLIGILLSFASAPILANKMSNNMVNSVHQNTTSIDEEEYNSIAIVQQYKQLLKGEDMMIYSILCLGILIVSSSTSILIIVKAKPKNVLM